MTRLFTGKDKQNQINTGPRRSLRPRKPNPKYVQSPLIRKPKRQKVTNKVNEKALSTSSSLATQQNLPPRSPALSTTSESWATWGSPGATSRPAPKGIFTPFKNGEDLTSLPQLFPELTPGSAIKGTPLSPLEQLYIQMQNQSPAPRLTPLSPFSLFGASPARSAGSSANLRAPRSLDDDLGITKSELEALSKSEINTLIDEALKGQALTSSDDEMAMSPASSDDGYDSDTSIKM